MDKAVKLAVIAGFLLAGFGVFYHYVVSLPAVEQRQAEQEEERRREAARQDKERRREAARHEAMEKEQAAFQQAAWQAEESSGNWFAVCDGAVPAKSE